RVALLPPPALRARLAQPFRVLADGPRDAPPRQRTLRSTITWSYDLLSPAEQGLFRRLAVFAGGCTLEAAEAVCRLEGTPDDPLAGTDMLAGLAALLAASLVRSEEPPPAWPPDWEPRFGMLTTIREFGREQLEATGEIGLLRARHAQVFLALLE